MRKQLDIAELNRLYSEAESVDQNLFSEQRSNVLLTCGDHYTKEGSRFWNRLRDYKDVSSEQKLRLTKNHIQKIVKTYVNNIVSFAPSVAVVPKNESELQDQKSAELHNATWQDIRQRHRIRQKTREWAEDYCTIGETFVKVFWDESAGKFLGYKAQQNELGQDVSDEQGQLKASETPVFAGDLVFERIFAFNVLRDPSAKSFEDAKYVCIRKMIDVDQLKSMVGDDEAKLKFITAGQDKTYTVFEGNQGYKQVKDQALLREFYFRPCHEYPQGWYSISTEDGILFEGELPLGIFPIKYVGFDEIPTCPRARSIIKQLRPYQAEINRAASKIAEHQITLGDDKILIQNGTKITNGGALPGVRAVSYTGMTPTFLPGRSGEQYLGYMQSQIKEMYEIANVYEDSEEKQTQLDPYALLFRSLRNKKKFSTYAEKFEQFLIDICETALRFRIAYSTPDDLVPAIGRREMINISELKGHDDSCYQIKLEPQSDDMETKLGKQITMTHVLQYVGGQLGKDDIGKILRNMPYVNEEEMLGDLTLDYDNAVNDILAMDRGDFRAANQYDNHPYMIKRLINRMKQADFQYLPPQVQQMYQAKIKQHEDMEAKAQAQILAAKSEYIPTGGYMVVCDLYVSDPTNPTKTRRARVPYQSLEWLIKKLDAQGMSLSQLEQMNTAAQADMASRFLQHQAQQPQMTAGPTPNLNSGDGSAVQPPGNPAPASGRI
jgi:hypothetical protein